MAADFEHLLATRYSELIRSRLQSDLVSEMCRTLLEPWLVGMLQSWSALHMVFATLADCSSSCSSSLVSYESLHTTFVYL